MVKKRTSMIGRLAVFVVLAVSSVFFIGAGHDDAWIMLLAGKGVGQSAWFVNPNGVPQEVSTSVLGSLLAAVVIHLSPEGSEFMWWKIATWLPAVFSGVLFHELLAKRCGRVGAGFWVLVLCCFPEWHYWAWGGVESGIFWLFLLLFVYSLARYSARQSALWAVILSATTIALPLVRADAFWSPFVAALAFFLNETESLRRRLVRGMVTLLLIVLFHLVRYHFTGKIFPNPAYAKVPLSLEAFQFGLEYMWRFHLETPLHFFLTLAYPLALVGVVRLLRNLVHLTGTRPGCFEWAGMILLVVDATTVVAGGDWMGYHRFAVRTLPLKLIVIAIWSKEFFIESARRARFAMAAGLAFSLSGLSSSGVVERPGLFRYGSAIAAMEVGDVQFGKELFVRSSIPMRRDTEVLDPWIAVELRSFVEEKRRRGSLPLKFASYQAGHFPWVLRQHFTSDEVLFIDLAGLSDYRIGGLPGAKNPLGRLDGFRSWAESIGLGQSVLGQALLRCRPDMVYVLRASDEQRLLMKRAGFELVYERRTMINMKAHSATIFQSQHKNDGKCPLLGVD